jgi:hypothetical protein
MSISRKMVLAVALCIGTAVFSFGETLLGFTAGYYRLSDTFYKEDFGRELHGISYNFSFHHFPGGLPLGFFTQASFGTLYLGYEWSDDKEMRSIGDNSISDIRLCFGSSFKIQLGSKVRIPLSLGPAISLYWERGHEARRRDNEDYFYEAFNLGIMGDASFIVSPSRLFFLRLGCSTGWDFFHVEKGRMGMSYRTDYHNRPKVEPYFAFPLSLYFGLGFRFH